MSLSYCLSTLLNKVLFLLLLDQFLSYPVLHSRRYACYEAPSARAKTRGRARLRNWADKVSAVVPAVDVHQYPFPSGGGERQHL